MHDVCLYSNCEAICNCVLKIFSLYHCLEGHDAEKQDCLFGQALSKCGFSRVIAEHNLKLFLV